MFLIGFLGFIDVFQGTDGSNVKIYFAGPLFTEAKREVDSLHDQENRSPCNESFRESRWKSFFPYDLVTQEEIDSLGAAAKFEIFSWCKSHLDHSDMLVALLDGSMVDDGTALGGRLLLSWKA